MSYNTPILFIIFNRPELTKLVFDRIKMIKPKYLFIAADGPRNKQESTLCNKTRDIVLKNIDWRCEVRTLFRKKNLGCKLAVSSSISWFFEQVSKGVIIEDDCLPTKSFFNFCEKSLKLYEEDSRVWSISGNNFISRVKKSKLPQTAYFSQYPHIWGWATWRRSWQKTDLELDLPQLKKILAEGFLDDYFNDKKSARYWSRVLNKTISGKINTWDTIFVLFCFLNNGLCLTPPINLVDNLGFCRSSTHTRFKLLNILPAAEEIAKIRYPSFVVQNRSYDSITDKLMFSRTTFWKRVIQNISKYV